MIAYHTLRVSRVSVRGRPAIRSQRGGVMPKRVVIAGCGVAGPALALFLQRIGWQPVICEAAAEPDDHGGLFLNVATNGLAVLDDLGLSERVLADAHACPHMVMWSGRGKRLGKVPNAPAGAP